MPLTARNMAIAPPHLSCTIVVIIGLICSCLTSSSSAGTEKGETRHRIAIVSSYDRGYLWSQETSTGAAAAFLEFGTLNDQEEIALLSATDHVENSRVVIRKWWMDSKRKSSRTEIAEATNRIVAAITEFHPDLILLGDDNAANYIGSQFIDTATPVVFWGINGLPLKYGLIDSLEEPGHNVTGVYQAGYLVESLGFLKRVVPGIETFAVLSDDSPTGRAKVKELQHLADAGRLPLRMLDSVVTNSFTEWKERALALQQQVDAFFVVNHNSIKDDNGDSIEQLTVGKWYLENIRIPECAHEKQFALEGLLCVCDDSGYNQGYEAVKLGYRILVGGEAPGKIAVRAPARGPLIINRVRAAQLGIDITAAMGVEEYVDKALALQ